MRVCRTAVCALVALGLAMSSATGVWAQAAGGRYNLAYLYFGGNDTFIKQVDATKDSVNRVSPTLFDLAADGSLKVVSDPSTFAAAMKQRGVKVVPFLSNHWNRDLGRLALANREALAQAIADAVVKYKLDGVNVDLENLTEADRDSYSDFVHLLRTKLPEGAELSVAIAANPSNWTRGWQASYDLAALAKDSDYLFLMAYDESWDGDPTPGAVASLPWVERSVKQALKVVPPEKLLLGVPFYGRFWKEGGGFDGASVTNKTAVALAARYGVEPKVDPVQMSATFTFTVSADDPNPPVVSYKKLVPGTYTVWFDNAETMKSKLDLVGKYGLKGAGSWALGQETPDTWTYFTTWLNGMLYNDTKNHWAEKDIQSASQSGWMGGTGPAVFDPEKPLTRAQAAAILTRAMKLADRPSAASAFSSGIPFTDVAGSYWGNKEIRLARWYGVIDGFPDGSFRPDAPVTREELSVMFYRALGYSGGAGTSPTGAAAFPDVQADRWSWQPVASMQGLGYLQGYADGTFRPQARITRAEAASLLTRVGPKLDPAAAPAASSQP